MPRTDSKSCSSVLRIFDAVGSPTFKVIAQSIQFLKKYLCDVSCDTKSRVTFLKIGSIGQQP